MLSHAILITGGTKLERENKVSEILSEAMPKRRPGVYHPNLHLVKSLSGRKNISIDQIRELKKFMMKKSLGSETKVAVIIEAHKMTVEAQNALLKTLEEPPKGSHTILTSSDFSLLLPTIISRCQIIKLKTKIDSNLNLENHSQYVESFLELLKQGRGGKLDWAEENKDILKNREQTVEMINSWLSVLRDLLLIKEGLEKEIMNKETDNYQLTINNSVTRQQIISSIDNLNYIKKIINIYNITPRLAIETFLLYLP